MSVQFKFLGTPRVEVGMESVMIGNNHTALLAYLAIEKGRFTRHKLASLLWGEQPEENARQNLRQAILEIRKVVPDVLVMRGRAFISLNLEAVEFLDVWDLEAAFRQGRFERVIDLYEGEFLEGIGLSNAPDFEDWYRAQQGRLQQIVVEALESLLRQADERREQESVLRYARRLIALVPWHEDAYRRLILILARQGDFNGALAAYKECEQTLQQELKIEPAPETTSLYERIQLARVAPRQHLPNYSTTFVGRESELAEITEILAHPDCRLLTLTGIGGIGKTRLATQVTKHVASHFLHGACFISLESTDEDNFIQAIAQGLGIALVGNTPFVDKLSGALASRETLLVLDSVERLRQIGHLVSQLLNKAPEVKFLITSRKRLKIYGEIIFELDGLTQPPSRSGHEEILAYDAVRLFFLTARRVKPDFQINDSNVSDIIAVVRLLGGMPLAIELAASKVHQYACSEILAELKSGLELLSHSGSGYAERHLSMMATFNYSWKYLSEVAKKTLAALSVFSGGFSRQAAEVVTGAKNSVLEELIEQCLIKRVDKERYDLHPLIHMFAAEKLRNSPATLNELRANHCRYYGERIKRFHTGIGALDLAKRSAAITVENTNIRAAWKWALNNHDLDSIQNLKHLWTFFELQALYQEGYAAFAVPDSWNNVPGLEEITSVLLARCAWFCFRLGRFQEGKELASRGWSLIQPAATENFLEEDAMTLYTLAMNHWYLGEYKEAKEHLQYTLSHYTEAMDAIGAIFSLHGLIFVAISTGEYQRATSLMKNSVQKIKLDWRSVAMYKMFLVQIGCYLSNYEQSDLLLQESRTVFEATQDKFMIAYNDCIYGLYYGAMKNHGLAIDHLETAIATSQTIGERWLEVFAELLLANILFDTNALELSNTTLQNALSQALAMDSMPQILSAEIQLCRNLLSIGKGSAEVLEILASASQHPAADFESRKLAKSLLAEHGDRAKTSSTSLDDPREAVDFLLELFHK